MARDKERLGAASIAGKRRGSHKAGVFLFYHAYVGTP